jgi:ActR/RegA family two-component response regulator
LVADNDLESARTMAAALRDAGFGAKPIRRLGRVAFELERGLFDVLVLEVRTRNQGLKYPLIREIAARFPHIDIVVATRCGSFAEERYALDHGAKAYLDKPVDPERLAAVVREPALARRPDLDRVKSESWTLDAVVHYHAKRVLARHGWVMTPAAVALEIHRSTLGRILSRAPYHRRHER